MSTFNYSLHKEFASGDYGPNKSLIENILEGGVLVPPSWVKNLEDFEKLFGSPQVFLLWANSIKDPNTPVRISHKRITEEVKEPVKDLEEITSKLSNEPCDMLILDAISAKFLLTNNSILLSNNKELTDHNFVRSSKTFKKNQHLRKSKILGTENRESVWNDRILPIFKNGTSVSYVDRHLISQHIGQIGREHQGPEIMLRKILEVKSITQLDVYAELPFFRVKSGPKQVDYYDVEEKTRELMSKVNKNNISLNFYLGLYKHSKKDGRGEIFKEVGGSSYFHVKGKTWSEKIEMDHASELFNDYGQFKVPDRSFNIGKITDTDSASLNKLNKFIINAHDLEDGPQSSLILSE